MYPYYSAKVFERVNLALLDLFDKIELNRYNPDGSINKILRVPITFHYSKTFAEWVLNSQGKPESKHCSPILGLRMGSPTRNITGITTTSHVRATYDVETNRIIRDQTPSAWSWQYTLTSYAEHIYDHFQIVENIMTYFNPYFNIRLREFEFSNIKRDVIVELVSVAPQYNDELDREKARSYVCDFTFNVKFDMYGPMYIAKLIKEVNMRIANSGQAIELVQNVEVDNMTVEEYNRAMNEIVNAGKLLDTVVVSTVTTTPTNQQIVTVNVNDDNEIPLITLPGGAKIEHVEVMVNNYFNDYDSLVSVGTDANHSSVLATTDSNLSISTRFSFDVNIPVLQETTFKVFYEKALATKGQFEILIRWSF